MSLMEMEDTEDLPEENERRALAILAQQLEFIPHESFAEAAANPALEATILQSLPNDEHEDSNENGNGEKRPKGLPPYLASLYEIPLLTKEQEVHLFREMNYLKFRAQTLCESLDPTKAPASVLDEIEHLQREAIAVRQEIVRANLRLVVSIAKRHIGGPQDFDELVSDGNMSLLRAVEGFDFARGNRFSAYASWAIMKNFARSISNERNRQRQFGIGSGDLREIDHSVDSHENESTAEKQACLARDAVHQILSKPSKREQEVLRQRFGLDESKKHRKKSLEIGR